MIDFELYEDNQDMLTDELIRSLQQGDKDARWKLVLIFKSEILQAGNKAARVLKEEFGRPNNGPEIGWLELIEKKLIKGYSSNFRLDYWTEEDIEDMRGRK